MGTPISLPPNFPHIPLASNQKKKEKKKLVQDQYHRKQNHFSVSLIKTATVTFIEDQKISPGVFMSSIYIGSHDGQICTAKNYSYRYYVKFVKLDFHLSCGFCSYSAASW